MLTQSALNELKRSIREVAGDEPARDILFRLGRMIGGRRAERLHAPERFVEAVREGIGHLDGLGIGRVELQLQEYDPDAHLCRLRGRIFPLALDTPTAAPSTNAEPRPAVGPSDTSAIEPDGNEGATCSVSAGFLTGLAAGLTGYDMVCDWLACPGTCTRKQREASSGDSCAFEVRPAYLGPPLRADGQPQEVLKRPQGSARFFLGDVGASMGHGEISLGDLVDSTGDAIVMLDLDGVIRYWNRGAERMFGYTPEEIVGRSFAVLMPGDLLVGGELDWIAERVARTGSLDNHLTRRTTRDGRTLVVSLTRTSLRNASGTVIGSTAVLRDETERKRIELDLQEARHLAMIGEMSATVAHDIKNPLAAIHAAVQYLRRGNSTEEERQQLLEEVGKEVYRVDETIQDLLRFSRPLPPRPQQIRALDFVEGVLEAMKLSPDLRRHQVEVEIEPELEVPIDREMLSRVLQNLLINASQAMEEPGRLQVRARLEGGEAVFDIRDTGGGVSDAVSETLFDPFVTSKVRGTGLGLPIARKHVEAHGGKLELFESSGAGSTFRFRLPMVVPAIPGRRGSRIG